MSLDLSACTFSDQALCSSALGIRLWQIFLAIMEVKTYFLKKCRAPYILLWGEFSACIVEKALIVKRQKAFRALKGFSRWWDCYGPITRGIVFMNFLVGKSEEGLVQGICLFVYIGMNNVESGL